MNRLFWGIKVLAGLTLLSLPFNEIGGTGRIIVLPYWVGQLLVIGGCVIHLFHYSVLRRQLSDLERPEHLVVSGGLFRWIRHPMYSGDILTMSGFLLMWSPPFAFVVWGIGTVCAILQAVVEDRGLRARFPEVHRQWSAQAGLLVPWLG